MEYMDIETVKELDHVFGEMCIRDSCKADP